MLKIFEGKFSVTDGDITQKTSPRLHKTGEHDSSRKNDVTFPWSGGSKPPPYNAVFDGYTSSEVYLLHHSPAGEGKAASRSFATLL